MSRPNIVQSIEALDPSAHEIVRQTAKVEATQISSILGVVCTIHIEKRRRKQCEKSVKTGSVEYESAKKKL